MEEARMPRNDASGLINRRKRKRALSRNWSGGQMNEAEIRLTKAIAIVEITDTEGGGQIDAIQSSQLGPEDRCTRSAPAELEEVHFQIGRHRVPTGYHKIDGIGVCVK